jgi:hypothetical protein
MDIRLVNTFLDLFRLIVIHCDRHQGLILSELGGELLGEAHAPAGSKRIGNLLRSQRWKAAQIDEELWQQGDAKVEQLNCSNDEALVWDESEIEKPESLQAEGLCPVRSSKARRLKRIKPGFYNPPGGRPILVPGYHWLQIVVAGRKGAARLAHLHWWSSRGKGTSDKRTEEERVLRLVARAWENRVIHIFDQGFAGAPWLGQLLRFRVRFVLRWKKTYTLIGPGGEAKSAGQWVAWEAHRKFLLIAALVHAFLILLLAPRFEHLKRYLLDTWCHRNGEWSRDTPTPLYRLRLALSHLWHEFPRVNSLC